MKGLCVSVVAALLAASLAAAGCSQAAPAPAPTQAPVKAAEPTKAAPAPAPPTAAPAAQPTAAPAKKVDYPQKGKTITNIVPWAPGGSVDVFARVVSPGMEKELGVPVQVVNKEGAGAQVGMTELAKSKADGHTIAVASLPGLLTIYLDPKRQAAFGNKDFTKVALQAVDPEAIVVKKDSPYQSLKDLADAAKANPGKVRIAAGGLMGDSHLGALLFQKSVGADFAIVTFDGGLTPAMTALLGGHADAYVGVVGSLAAVAGAGEIRVLGVEDTQESKFLPGVKTVEAQGFKNVVMGASRGTVAPAGTPPEIVDILSQAIRKTQETEDVKKKLEGVWTVSRYMGPADFAAFWDKLEADTKPLMASVK